MNFLIKRGPSHGGRALANVIGIRALKPSGRVFKRATIINWGCGTHAAEPFLSRVVTPTIINEPSRVSVASDKRECFEHLHEMRDHLVPHTSDINEAQGWLNDGGTVVARHQLHGHSGQGIELTDSGTVPRAPLYTLYIKKLHEFRVHVCGDKVDVQHKRKRSDVDKENVDYKIRNHSSGWVYCRENLEYRSELVDIAKQAIATLHLDFGAVDIIYNKKKDKYYILEVNTAPGLEGRTLEFYKEALEEML